MDTWQWNLKVTNIFNDKMRTIKYKNWALCVPVIHVDVNLPPLASIQHGAVAITIFMVKIEVINSQLDSTQVTDKQLYTACKQGV